jgi:hypothetical protein
MIIFHRKIRLDRSQVNRFSNKSPIMDMDAINVAQDLENEFGIPCVRGIQVNRNAQGKKVPIGDRGRRPGPAASRRRGFGRSE